MFKVDLGNFIDRVVVAWPRRSTIILVLLVGLIVLLWVFSGINIEHISMSAYFYIVSILVIIFGIWLFTNRLEKTGKDKIGFVIAISTETDEHKQRIVSDLIANLRLLIMDSVLKYKFQFIVLPNHHALKVDSHESADKYLKKLRAHFMIFGRARMRKIGNVDNHIFDLRSLVKHAPLPLEVSKEFSKEFSQLFPSKIEIPIENDYKSFEQVSLILSIVSKYMIGTASYITRDYDYSESLFNDLMEKLLTISNKPVLLANVFSLVRLRLIDIFSDRANIAYNEWRKNSSAQSLSAMKMYLEKIDKIDKHSYFANLLNALLCFVIDRDVVNAKKYLIKCRNNTDVTWKFSYAFLFAYEGDLKTATMLYEQLLSGTYPADIPLQVEEFIHWVLETDLNKNHYHLYYCLGLINLKFKNDVDACVSNFSAFLEQANSDLDSDYITAAIEVIKSNKDT